MDRVDHRWGDVIDNNRLYRAWIVTSETKIIACIGLPGPSEGHFLSAWSACHRVGLGQSS